MAVAAIFYSSSPNLIHHWLYRNQTGCIAL
jgi:hypothetical protein